MKERPILFSGPMVRAILEGRKTQTRRVMKPQPAVEHVAVPDTNVYESLQIGGAAYSTTALRSGAAVHASPYGRPGDRLWVRETWNAKADSLFGDFVDDVGQPLWYHNMRPAFRKRDAFGFVVYRADESSCLVTADGWDAEAHGSVGMQYLDPTPDLDGDLLPPPRWMPSIHMPRWASRLTLEITEVRVERVQAITEADAVAEGVNGEWAHVPDGWLAGFRALWDSINAERGYGWSENPWVWVVSFRRVEQ